MTTIHNPSKFSFVPVGIKVSKPESDSVFKHHLSGSSIMVGVGGEPPTLLRYVAWSIPCDVRSDPDSMTKFRKWLWTQQDWKLASVDVIDESVVMDHCNNLAGYHSAMLSRHIMLAIESTTPCDLRHQHDMLQVILQQRVYWELRKCGIESRTSVKVFDYVAR
jgi:hypothetical protein